MIRRLIRSLLTWPDLAGWLQSGLISAVTLALIVSIAAPNGLFIWQPHPSGWLMRLLSVMCVPAFSEELVFRGLLVPDRGETRRPGLWIGLAVLAFTAWHVVEALFILPGAHLFMTPAFLLCAGLLGLGCALIRYRTGSIWPAVILHALLVWTWQTGFGGPDIRQLLAHAA
ncbi:MAG: CPBP family glutamic-type intramembrane protease [Asticcacaulis sp.]|uniref:CPBP family glutamic-type intramembrane protease n=1 Tax=Asticcacaulis sp. TaxID=1872648 RepID=UPI0039E29317